MVKPPGKANMRTEAIDPPGITWQRVSPKYVTVRMVQWALANVATVLVLALPLVLVLAGVWAWPPLWLAVAVPAVALVSALWRLALIPRQVRAIGYAERDDDLLIRTGIFFQRTMAVPYGRMQYVDIGVGPVERGLGLCTLKLHTASPGTNAQIPGLPAAEGARLREQLAARGEARLAGL
jgi:membrane protein YdbS with pleckstrin-like domain